MTWTPKVGQACEYFLEGYRYGIVVAVPIKGQHKGMIRVENPTPRWMRDDNTGLYIPKPKTREWVDAECVWEAGTDAPRSVCPYLIGNVQRTIVEKGRERAAAKAAEQERADKKRKTLAAEVFRR